MRTLGNVLFLTVDTENYNLLNSFAVKNAHDKGRINTRFSVQINSQNRAHKTYTWASTVIMRVPPSRSVLPSPFVVYQPVTKSLFPGSALACGGVKHFSGTVSALPRRTKLLRALIYKKT